MRDQLSNNGMLQVEHEAMKQFVVEWGLIFAWLAFSAMLGLLIARGLQTLA